MLIPRLFITEKQKSKENWWCINIYIYYDYTNHINVIAFQLSIEESFQML